MNLLHDWLDEISTDLHDGPLPPESPARKLIAVVLLDAVEQYRYGNERQRVMARAWLRNDVAERYCDLVGIDVDAMRERLGIVVDTKNMATKCENNPMRQASRG